MEIKVNTIITLENGEKYVVLNETMYQNNKYYLVMGMDENKEVIQSKVAIFEQVKINEEVYVEKVNDSKLIIELTNLLFLCFLIQLSCYGGNEKWN